MSRLLLSMAVAALAASLAAVVVGYVVYSEVRGLSSRLGSGLGELETRLVEVGERLGRVEEEVGEARSLVELASRPRVSVRYARLFSVVYDGPVKVVRDAEGRVLLLAPRGSGLVESYVERYNPDSVVYTPVERVVLMSATQAALLYRLGVECGVDLIGPTLVGFMWGREYEWFIEEVGRLLEEGSVADVGPASNPDVEAILGLEPDVVVIYTYPGSPVFSGLVEAGLPVAVDNEYLEPSVLGRFEWIKFLALFYDLEACAERVFDDVESSVLSVSESVENAVPSEGERPVVAWFTVFGGSIYAAKPVSYVADMIRLAGGVYAFKDLPFGRPTPEYIIARGEDVDVLVYSSTKQYGPRSLEDLLSRVEFAMHVRAVREGRVYLFSPDYWQLGLAYTEDLVGGLASVLHPGLFEGREPRFFEKLE